MAIFLASFLAGTARKVDAVPYARDAAPVHVLRDVCLVDTRSGPDPPPGGGAGRGAQGGVGHAGGGAVGAPVIASTTGPKASGEARMLAGGADGARRFAHRHAPTHEHAPVCNSPDPGKLTFLKRQRALLKNSTLMRKIYSGVSSFIKASHGQGSSHFMWDNFEHWTEGCVVFHSHAQRYAAAIRKELAFFGNRSFPAMASVRVGQVVFPQIQAPRRDCGLANRGVSAVLGRGGGYSEAFEALARAATQGLRAAGVDVVNPLSLYCADVAPRIFQNGSHSVACFEAVVFATPQRGMFTRDLVNLTGTERALRSDAWEVLGKPRPRDPKIGAALAEATLGHRVVALLTRRGGPVWKNRGYVVGALEKAVRDANEALRVMAASSMSSHQRTFAFVDLGHAEDLGASNNCVHSAEQAAAWQSSWLVIAPHGAHSSNVIFMNSTSAGLVESFSCGHSSNPYELLARASGVPYSDAHELDDERQRKCGTDLGRRHLDEPRAVDFDHDTLLEVVRLKLASM